MRDWAARHRLAPGVCVWVAVLCSFTACGRIGVKLLPSDSHRVHGDSGQSDSPAQDGGASATAEDAAIRDGGANTDAAPAADGGATDGGPNDGGVTDGGSDAGGADAGGAADAGSDAGSDAGGCAVLCENAHGTAACVAQSCQLTCAIGYGDCDDNSDNGCETNTSDQATSCGSCTLACSNSNGTTACGGGLCSPACSPGFGDCDQDPNNGCEADIETVGRCGACGVSCTNANGTTSCTSGACTPSCAPSYLDCDGDVTNGCETDSANDPAHCGSCAKACGSNSQICVAGVCKASPCMPGLGECDGDLTVTCETNTNTSPADCGFCGNACMTANATPACAAGMCEVGSCDPGHADCDTAASNGCEEALATSTAHCGNCSTACTNAHGTTGCAASTCVPSCGSGFGDCDNSRQNGCETTLDSVSNCGMCGKTCPAGGGTAICTGGTCDVLCDLTGTFAIKVSFQVSWSGLPNVSNGSGTAVAWIMLQGTQSGNDVAGTVSDCGRTIPGFNSNLLSETYTFGYPNSLFDHAPAYLPSSAATVSFSKSSPGAALTLPKSALLMGLSMADPVNGAWPSIASMTKVDMDMDGKAGVTVAYKNGGGYSYPPTSSSFGFNRTNSAYIAGRLVFALGGTLTSCTQASGSATVTRADVHIIGAKRTTGTDCNATENNFLDSNHPKYTFGTASYSLVKVAAAATCTDVRAALP